MIRTTNVIGPVMAGFREARWRLKVMGCLQSSESCDRIIYAIFNYLNTKIPDGHETQKRLKRSKM
jgi:transposase-like protein